MKFEIANNEEIMLLGKKVQIRRYSNASFNNCRQALLPIILIRNIF